MKKHFIVLSLFISSLLCAESKIEKRIKKLVAPYQSAIDFIDQLDGNQQLQDHDVFLFFNTTGLYPKKDVRKFNSTVRIVKRLASSSKIAPANKVGLNELINNLHKIQSFIANYASTYFTLITYYEICAYYYYLDEHNPAIVNALMQQTKQLGLPFMEKRGLYALRKKIDLDLRRLTALFNQKIISDDLIIKINQIKTKLLILKNKIISSPQYASQLRKTRILKAVGVVIVPLLIAIPIISIPATVAATAATYGISYASIYTLTSFGMTIHELRESTRYNIPVHSESLFSWFMPAFWPLTWIPRS